MESLFSFEMLNLNCTVLKVEGCPRGGGNWGTLRIPAGMIGEP